MYKNSSIIAFFLILGQFLSIYRERLLAHIVGVGPVLDVYNASFKIPDLLFSMIAGFVSASTIVPFISRSHVENNHSDKNARLNSAFFVFGFIIFAASLITFIILPYITKYFADGFTFEQNRDLILYTRILLLQPILLGASTLISNIAQMKEKFFIFSVAPLLYTLGNIFGIVYLYKYFGTIGIVYGVIIGAVAHLLLQSITLINSNIKLSFESFSIKIAREHFKLALPRTASYFVTNFRVLVYASFAISLGPAVLSIYTFAQKLIDVPINIFTQSIASSSLPKLSLLHEEGNNIIHKKIFYKTFFILFLMSSASSAVLYFGSDFLAKIIYGFDTPGVEDIIYVTKILSPLAISFSLSWFVTTAFNSRKQPKIILYSNIVATVFSFLIFYILKYNLLGVADNLPKGIILAVSMISFSYTCFACLLITYYIKYLRKS